MDSKALLSLNHLSVWYTADHPLLSDFSLDLGAAEDQSFRYFTFREYLTYVAASYGVPLPDLSGLIRGFHFENYANVLLSVADLLPLPAIALARGVAAREMLVLPPASLRCFSQYCSPSSQRFGQPGWRQGRLGFLGMRAASFRTIEKPRKDYSFRGLKQVVRTAFSFFRLVIYDGRHGCL